MPLNRICKLVAALVLGSTVLASAQVTIPNTFTANTVAQSALVNANFSQLGTQALNRAGGIITGNISVDPGVTIDGIDIGAVLGGTGTPTFATITTTGTATIGTTLTVSSTGASAIDVAGGINAGSGNVSIIGTDGRIPDISSTTFASLSGANLTGLLEANITDGTILARVAANETISGTYTFTAASMILANVSPTFRLNATGAGTDLKNWFVYTPSTEFHIAACTDTLSGCTDALLITRSTTTPILSTFGTGMAYAQRIAPTTLGNGDNNNWAPTGFSNTYMIVATGGTSSKITGIAGGTAGRTIVLCYATTAFTIEGGNAGSTGINQFANEVPILTVGPTGGSGQPCITIVYDASIARWRVTGKLT